MHADGSPRFVRKFGVYDDDRPVFDWMRQGAVGTRQCLEAQVMDLADDVAYSVHDIEDGVVAGRVDLTAIDPRRGLGDGARLVPPRRRATTSSTRRWPGCGRSAAGRTTPYDGSRRSLAALKNLTSDLIGRFCGAVQHATFAASDGPFVRYAADLVVPEQTRLEIAVLKGDRRPLRDAGRRPGRADGAAARAAGRAGRGCSRTAGRTRWSGRSPTTGPPPPTTPPGCGS